MNGNFVFTAVEIDVELSYMFILTVCKCWM